MNVEHRLALVEVTARAEGTQAELGAAVRGKLGKQGPRYADGEREQKGPHSTNGEAT
jgi:hypothetical protein